ncbi:ABC transporter substrate-binding protein [Halalkalibacter sp. APA_J-10(15)]|uniref:ABC transporter substrate-binding protein n=1 Tax=Halalkalibacter sp. APA_J-10(15) TaxID=2933805 RepID=UPI001FF546D0|nr:ABC transporter substrate-binding protein [Halalkalibacter sp. APA_J-10(15)]MCK0471783.1 ABC transporter substrate-binding protein [Halalkalibacter sp. APA_J-10(15)]
MHSKVQLFLVFLLLLLVGCNSESSSSSPEAIENVETKLYTDVTGREVEIPVEPTKVVTTQFLDALLALDITPIGAPSHVLDNEYLGDLQEGVADLGHPYSIEKIIELKPDLIITSDPDEVEQLMKIAPTVVVPWMYGDVFAQFKEIASILGKEQQAEQWIASLDNLAANVQEDVATKISEDETVSIFMTFGKDVLRIYGGRNIGHIIYRSLDLTPPTYIKDRLEQDPTFEEFVFDQISMEMLPEYAGDHIIMLVYDQEARDEGGMFHQVEESTLWQNLEAVQNEQVYYIDPDPWFSYSPIAIEKSLEKASKLFSN